MKIIASVLAPLLLALGCASQPSDQAIRLVNTLISESENGYIVHQTDLGVYVGLVKDGQPNGFGTWYLKDRMIYTGVWKDGALHGEGTAIHIDGDSLAHGEFKDGQLSGKGYLYHSGKGFYGNFERDIPMGEGECINSDSISPCLGEDFQ